MPTKRTVQDIKTNLLRPALTSHFEIEIAYPTLAGNFADYMRSNGVGYNADRLHLMCSEATLPGSSLATHEINNDYHGVTERHVYRRLYDDRIDLTFYVDAENYMSIRFFETWIKYIVNESIAEQRDGSGPPGATRSNYSYRMRYPNEYKGGLVVTKFERDYQTQLSYEFLSAFPISITSIPISYESSSLLKCTVSMTYIRYLLRPSGKNNDALPKQSGALSPAQQAQINNDYNWSTSYNPIFEGQFSVGGVSDISAQSSGNTVDRRVEAGLPFVGRNVGPIAPFSGI